MSAGYVVCVHLERGACARGHDVDKLRDEDLRLPCMSIRGVFGAVPCDDRQLPRAPVANMAGPMSTALERTTAGLCPQCGAPVEREVEVGDSVFAAPCQHRLGRAPR